jgi:methanogenic corrinoid protein MtbC1
MRKLPPLRTGQTVAFCLEAMTDAPQEIKSQETSEEGMDPPHALPALPSHLDACIAAVKSLDSHALDEAIKRAAVDLGAQGLLQRVIAPLAQNIGTLWQHGIITAAHEHFASAVIRIFLGHAARPFLGSQHAPMIVVGTPTGQMHELGALLVGAAATNLGWHVTYLGASLPAAEIAGVVRQSSARVVALSLVHPEDDPHLAAELMQLRDALPVDVTLIVGGRAMPAYRDTLDKIDAIQVEDLAALDETLDALRKLARK